MSPGSVAGVRAGRVEMVAAGWRMNEPPGVVTVIACPAIPCGTVTSTTCCDSPSANRSWIEPGARVAGWPPMETVSSPAASPVPSMRTWPPAVTDPPTDRKVGTTWSSNDPVAPTTCSMPVTACAGTTSVSVVPSAEALPVRVNTPAEPAWSSAGNCTRVEPLKPRPTSVIVWPTTAEAAESPAGVPAVATAVSASNSTNGGGAAAGIVSCAQPPAVVTRMVDSTAVGITMPERVSLRAPLTVGSP